MTRVLGDFFTTAGTYCRASRHGIPICDCRTTPSPMG